MLKPSNFYKDKKVIVRVDYNVPIKNGSIEDNNRIVCSLKTINYLIDTGAKIILMSHLGKIKTEEDKLKNSLYIVSIELSKLLGKDVKFCKSTRGSELESMINSLHSGEVMLVENTRYEDFPNNLESSCDKELSSYWASLADEYVMDAFGSIHRNHASTYGIASILGGVTGFLVDEELEHLKEVFNNKNKILILGGAKVSDKLGVIENLVNDSNKILLGGGMCFTFLKALGKNIGKSIVDEEKVDYCKELLSKYKDKIILPLDIVTEKGNKSIDNINDDDIGFDIGNDTIGLYKSLITNDDLVVWNGPMGKFEDINYEKGTRELLEYLNRNNIKTIICGGDTGSASKKYRLSFYYISTGGGASLEYLEGKKFDTLEVLNK